MENILVLIKVPSKSDPILQVASKMAACFSSKLWIIHVADPDPDFMGYEEGPDHERTWKAEEFHSEHKVIQEIAKELEQENIDATALLIQGSIVDVIQKQVKKLNIDLIIMGVHHHTMIESVLFSNTPKAVIKNISCPLLLIPAAE